MIPHAPGVQMQSKYTVKDVFLNQKQTVDGGRLNHEQRKKCVGYSAVWLLICQGIPDDHSMGVESEAEDEEEDRRPDKRISSKLEKKFNGIT